MHTAFISFQKLQKLTKALRAEFPYDYLWPISCIWLCTIHRSRFMWDSLRWSFIQQKSCGFNSHFLEVHGIGAGPGVEFWAKPSPQTKSTSASTAGPTAGRLGADTQHPVSVLCVLHNRVLVSRCSDKEGAAPFGAYQITQLSGGSLSAPCNAVGRSRSGIWEFCCYSGDFSHFSSACSSHGWNTDRRVSDIPSQSS